MSLWKHLREILVLPGMVTIVVPGVLLYVGKTPLPPILGPLTAIGAVCILVGLALLVTTDWLFLTVGRGSLAPWNPTQRLVVRGVYRHVRNPMISGVFCILLGETLLFRSQWLLGWCAFFAVVNLLYIPLAEEPGLLKRFGADYQKYRRHVPRWIPRLRPWRSPSNEKITSKRNEDK